MDKVYLDSCLVIYLVERHPRFFVPLRERLATHADATFCVSALTRLEVLARPLREHDEPLVRRYEAFLKVHERLPIDDAMEHPRIKRFRDFLKGWYLSYFYPDAARSLPSAGPQRHLYVHGDNIGNVVQFMERDHRDRFKRILKRIAAKIPGISGIDTLETQDKRVLLRFNDGAFQDPFFARQMSDGTLKVFAYLLLLEDPDPPPFICIEEPENGLYHKLLETLAKEFRFHATGKKGAPQIFVTTHQPYFVDPLTPEEVWVLQKGGDGFSTIQRVSELEEVTNLVVEGLPLGGLWYSDYLDAR